MPFDNPIQANGNLILPALRSPNYQPGGPGWEIRKDGTAEFASITLSIGYGDLDPDVVNDIATALSDAANALMAAATAQDTADGKITTFIQPTAPVAEGVGDLWMESDDGNKLWRWNGSAWVNIQDTGIVAALTGAALAQATADGKITTFISGSAPTAEGVGDLWYHTGQDNKLYRWDGASWVAVQVGTDAISDDAIDSSKITDLASSNFASGVLGWAIFQNGDAEFHNILARGDQSSFDSLSVNNELYYQGDLLESDLAGKIVLMGRSGSGVPDTELPPDNGRRIFAIGSFTAKANRRYVARFCGGAPNTAATVHGVQLYVNTSAYTLGSTAPGGTDLGDYRAGGDFQNHAVHWAIPVQTADTTLHIGLAVVSYGTTDGRLFDVGAEGMIFDIVDHGPSLANALTWRFTGPVDVLPGTLFDLEIDPSSTTSYDGSSVLINTDGTMYAGFHASFSAQGNAKSRITFPSGVNSSGNLGHLNGLAVDKLETFELVWYARKHQAGSGFRPWTVRYGYRTTGGVDNANVFSETYLSEASFHTVNLLNNSTIRGALLGGTLSAILLGPGPDSSPVYGGYGDGRLQTNPPFLRLKYRK